MSEPDFELQKAIYQKLMADAAVSSHVGDRVFDRVPANAKYPLVGIGEAQSLRDDAVCLDGWQSFLTLHAWSRAVGFEEVKKVAGAVVSALHRVDLAVESFRLVSINHRQTRTFGDPDGLTSHAVIEMVAYVEKPAA